MESRSLVALLMILPLATTSVLADGTTDGQAIDGHVIGPHHVGDNVTIEWDDGETESFYWTGPVLIRDAESRLVEAQAVYWPEWDGWTYHRGEDMREVALDDRFGDKHTSSPLAGPVALETDHSWGVAFFRWSDFDAWCIMHVAAWRTGCYLEDPGDEGAWNATMAGDELVLEATGAWHHRLVVPQGAAYPSTYTVTDGNETRTAAIHVERGDGPQVQPSAAVHEEAPAFNSSALQPWGPSDTGARLDMRGSSWNWPASEAFADAKADLEGVLAAHLERFPESRAVGSHFEAQRLENRAQELSWTFTMSGSPGLKVIVNRTVVAETLAPRVTVHTDSMGAIPHPPAQTQAPDIADLQRIWGLHRNQSAVAPVAWGHSVNRDGDVTVFLGGVVDTQRIDGGQDGSFQIIEWRNGRLSVGFGVDLGYSGARLRIIPPVSLGSGDGGDGGNHSADPAPADPSEFPTEQTLHATPTFSTQDDGHVPVADAAVPGAVVSVAVVAGTAAGAAAAGWSLKWLFGALFSRVAGAAVAKHPMRRRILDVVEAEPGIHLRRLQDRLHLGNGALRYHVKRLRDAGLIVQQSVQGRQALSLPSQRDAAKTQALMHGRTGDVMRLIKTRPGMLVKEMHEHSGIPMSTLHHHLRTLRQSGLVRADGGRYRPLA